MPARDGSELSVAGARVGRTEGDLARLVRSDAAEALRRFLARGNPALPPTRANLIAHLAQEIGAIDRLLSAQMDALLHHPLLQALEARWRGLLRLVSRAAEEDDELLKIRVLDASWRDLVRDGERAIEFDQSQLFQKVYSEEFGSPGGEPFAVLIGDYEIRLRRTKDHPEDDVGALRSIAQVAAAAFAPFIAAAHPSLFELESYRDLERSLDLGQPLRRAENSAWSTLRRLDDARFVGLCLPRILMRAPYRDDPARADGWLYRENASALDGSGYLWGSAAWAFGEVLLRAFATNGWLAQIRGVERDQDAGGLVPDLPQDWFLTERARLVTKGPLEVRLSADQERELIELGFLALSPCQGTGYAAFLGAPSLRQPIQAAGGAQQGAPVVVNDKLSSMLHYMFCVARFAHYVKVLGREKVGSYTQAAEIQAQLQKWLSQYAISNEAASPELQAKYPLREARVEVRELPGRPGIFQTIVHLRPHYQIDQMTTSVKLVTELFAAREV
ncbi:MAG: type VI secretion system contractile sheath large subunit [Planctomycetes bacterium]|nr:type VI secretion system contractile sheath large subunit [Planctomycetota bacterium]